MSSEIFTAKMEINSLDAKTKLNMEEEDRLNYWKSRLPILENRRFNRLLSQKKTKKSNLKKLNALKSQRGCKYCKEKDIRCLDFHHIQEKSFGISQAKSWSWKKIESEINKCEVVCANCHRKIHMFNARNKEIPRGEKEDSGT